MEQLGTAVLIVQRLDVSQSGLLNLRLFQRAGDVLLQSLKVRQSTEVRGHHVEGPYPYLHHWPDFFLSLTLTTYM